MKPSKKFNPQFNFNQIVKISTTIVIAILASYFIYFQITTSSIFYIYSDPEIAYLFSSISIFKGQPYVLTDHPGTPFQVLGTLLLLFTYPITALKSEPFFIFNLSYPNYFLVIARLTLFIFSSITLYFLAKETVKNDHWTNLLKSITVIASFYAIHPDSFLSLTLWSHNSLNFPAGVLVLLVIWITLNKDKQINRQDKLIIGFTTGALTAHQLYFITWIIGALISFGIYEWYIFNRYKKVASTVLVIGFSSIGGFLAMTIPILKRLPNFFSFVFTLVTHSDLYGAGENLIISPERYIGNLFIFSKMLAPLFLTVPLLMIGITILIFLRKWDISFGVKSFTIGLFVQIIVLFVIIIKHPQRIFFLSIAATVPFLILIVYKILDNKKGYRNLDFRIFTKEYNMNSMHLIIIGGFILLMILFVKNLNTSFSSLHNQVQWLHNQEKSVEIFAENYSEYLSKAPQEFNILWTYETNSPCSSRWYGNPYGNFAFTDEIITICKNNFYISLWSNEVLTTQGWVNPYSYPWDFIVIKDWMVEKNAFPNVISNGIPIDLEESDLTVILPEEKALEYLNK